MSWLPGIFPAGSFAGAAWHRGRRVLATYLVALFAAEAFKRCSQPVTAWSPSAMCVRRSQVGDGTLPAPTQFEHQSALEARKTGVDNAVIIKDRRTGLPENRCKALLDFPQGRGANAISGAPVKRRGSAKP